MDDKKLVTTTVSSREAGIRRRTEGMTTRSQKEIKTCKEQENENVRRRGGSSQGLKHIDPLCIRNKNKDAGMKSNEIERTRGEGGDRHHHRDVEGDVPLCMRMKVDEDEAKSKENEKFSSSREKCDCGSKEKTNMLVVKAKAQEAAAPKQTRQQVESKSEKDMIFIILQKNMRSLNSHSSLHFLSSFSSISCYPTCKFDFVWWHVAWVSRFVARAGLCCCRTSFLEQRIACLLACSDYFLTEDQIAGNNHCSVMGKQCGFCVVFTFDDDWWNTSSAEMLTARNSKGNNV